MLDRSEYYLTHDEEQRLLRIARDALERWVLDGTQLDLQDYPLTPALREKHGAFVTLRLHGQLRGCIGHTVNREPLAFSVRDNAINAATRDPRFPPLAAEEALEVQIEVSALTPGDTPDTPFKRVRDLGEIKIGRDGLYIERLDQRGGLLLPQVASEQGWDVDQFLKAVCVKAGYPDGAWAEKDALLYRFSAQVFAEPPRISG
jgi:AmmeMemoRadiSam system protein A